MLLQEAAGRAHQATAPMLGRPTCMAVPAALGAAPVVSSLGCIGNRVYTSLGDDELYVVVRATALQSLVAELGTIVGANATLAEYHQQRLASIAGA